jgi:uncharacterized cofD-like protein
VTERAPDVIAFGGGHGLSVALHALREYAGAITAVVSVADDGGSSGRLRRDLDIPAPGDLRRCLVALASADGPWADAFEHRFGAGELAGHALGNLVLAGLCETLGDLVAALDEAGRLLGAVGRVLPATLDAVSLTADVGGRRVTGQVAIADAGRHARIRDVRLEPEDPRVPDDARRALREADQVLLAPGSLFTSTVAVLAVPELRAAIAGAGGVVVQVANLASEHETRGLDGTDHLAAVRAHGGRVDVFLYDPDHGLPVDEARVRDLEAVPYPASIARPDSGGHDPVQLAKALSALL